MTRLPDDVKKTMHMPVSNAHSSFQSPCVKIEIEPPSLKLTYSFEKANAKNLTIFKRKIQTIKTLESEGK